MFQRMLKAAKILKTEPFATPEAALRGALARLPKVRFLRADGDARGCRVDATVNDEERSFLVRTAARPEPKWLRAALGELAREVKDSGEPTIPVVYADFFSEAAQGICREAGVGFVDAYGNCRLSFDGQFVEILLYTRPGPARHGGAKSLFAPASARALRVLLDGPPRAWKTEALTAAGHLSAGTAAQVRRVLVEQEWAVADGAGLRLTQPDALLDAWAAADDFSKRTEVREYASLITDPEELARKLHEALVGAGVRHAFTQWHAAWLRRPHTAVGVVGAYVENFPPEALIKSQLLAAPVSAPGGGRLRLIVPKDAGVFTPTQTVAGLPLVSDVQLYLDLLRAGLRGDEAARELRAAPDFRGAQA